MKYLALLRGINVGGKHKVEMKRLKALFESLGFLNVSTYINSGNVFFESGEIKEVLGKKIETNLKKEFGFNVPTLIKKITEIKKMAEAIPPEWQNDAQQKTDVAYLFREVDSEKIIKLLPVKKEFINLKYVQGAIIWNAERKYINKSQLTKIIGHKIYQSMTVRNVNTARYLAGNRE